MGTGKGTGPDLDKLRKLLEAGRELHTKMGAVLDEIDELTGGGAGIAAKLKTFQVAFDAAWCQRYARGEAGRYVWRFATDVPNQKRLIKALGLEELIDRAGRFIANDDPFLLRNRHPFGLFVSGINSYAGEGAASDLDLGAAPVGCKHTPQCATDEACTRKRRAEMRA